MKQLNRLTVIGEDSEVKTFAASVASSDSSLSVEKVCGPYPSFEDNADMIDWNIRYLGSIFIHVESKPFQAVWEPDGPALSKTYFFTLFDPELNMNDAPGGLSPVIWLDQLAQAFPQLTFTLHATRGEYVWVREYGDGKLVRSYADY